MHSSHLLAALSVASLLALPANAADCDTADVYTYLTASCSTPEVAAAYPISCSTPGDTPSEDVLISYPLRNGLAGVRATALGEDGILLEQGACFSEEAEAEDAVQAAMANLKAEGKTVHKLSF
ncbi:MAG: hypothetical protein CMK06_04865 [Ponticaulis sp.]|nr:hypothetical protein [Ponticaulis sp.]